MISITEYKKIYSQLDICLYTINSNSLKNLRLQEQRLFSRYGLPTNCLEILSFDNIPTEGEHLILESALFVFGSIADSASPSYLFIDQRYKIKLLVDNRVLHVNDSLEQFLCTITSYIQFIRELHLRNKLLDKETCLHDEDYFEIYYQIRKTDTSAVRKHTLWYQLICNTFVYKSKILEYK